MLAIRHEIGPASVEISLNKKPLYYVMAALLTAVYSHTISPVRLRLELNYK